MILHPGKILLAFDILLVQYNMLKYAKMATVQHCVTH